MRASTILFASSRFVLAWALERVQVQRLTFLVNGVPCQELAHTLLEIFQAIAVSPREDQGVAIATACFPRRFIISFAASLALLLLVTQRMGKMWFEDNQPNRSFVIGDICAGGGARRAPCEGRRDRSALPSDVSQLLRALSLHPVGRRDPGRDV